ncbi:MAG: hypothetical protein IIW13_00495 [Paludibacteraceae bacterium]|nr:hypothetical protein [Paludibacteraceae bacterium]
MKYTELLEKNCIGIKQAILDDMKENRYSVKEIKENKQISVPESPILYRWWFPESFVEKYLQHKELKELLGKVEKEKINDNTYYALYFGKSNNGHRRFQQHTTGNVKTSTLRQTLHGLCINKKYKNEDEKEITEIINQCYYEWFAPDENEARLIECLEAICIALGHYPLNLDGNPAIPDKWKNKLMDMRSKAKIPTKL